MDAMARNVEIKARIESPERLEAIVRSLSDSGREIIEQDDFFFRTPDGKLKLRIFGTQGGELIYYDRLQSRPPQLCRYRVVKVDDPYVLKEILSSVLGGAGRIRKVRAVYRVGQTRVHVDRVEGLGEFVELECVLEDDQDEGEGRRIVLELMKKLGIDERELIRCSYIDLAGGKPE
jgi:predicted adenylyl cyclase CyaB